MSADRQGLTDEQVEQVVGNLLRTGVLLAAAVVLAGGVLFLARHGTEEPDNRTFRGEPAALRHPLEIIEGAVSLRARAIIQMGLLLLIATPVARVAFSVYAFARQRDLIYVVVTLIVLGVLLYSLLGGYLDDRD